MTTKKFRAFLETIYKLKTLIRYNNTPRIMNESVAEHMYFVAMIVYRLYDDYDFDLYIALRMSLFHDIPEVHLSDMPNNTKEMFPEIAAAVKKSQKSASDMIDSAMTPLVEDYENQSTKEAKIVKMADILSILQYTGQEKNLGNEYMRKIYNRVVTIADKCFDEIEVYKRAK